MWEMCLFLFVGRFDTFNCLELRATTHVKVSVVFSMIMGCFDGL